MRHIVVAGGTGFIGRKLVRHWTQSGSRVTALARDTAAARERLGPEVRVVRWSLEKPGKWQAAVDDANVVVNLAGAGVMDARWTEGRKRELVSSRVDVTRALAEAIARSSGPPAGRRAFISASAIGIYGTREDDVVVDEDTPPASDFLAELCVQWEAAAEPARKAGVRVVHPRFGLVLAEDGGALAAMLTPFRWHAGGPIGSGRQWMSWIHWRDALSACELLMTDDALVGPYNLVAPAPVTMNALAQAIAEVRGTHAAARVPAFAMKALLGGERARSLLTGQRASAARLTALGFAFSFPDVEAALRDLLGAK